MKSDGKKLVNALQMLNYSAVVDLATKNKSKKEQFSFAGTLKTFNNKELEDVWKLVTDMAIQIADHAFENKEKSRSSFLNEMNEDTTQPILIAAMDIAAAVFDLKIAIPNPVLHLAIYLNGIIFQIHNEVLKNTIAQFCEKVYHHTDLKERSQYFLYNTITYLLIRSLNPKATKTDVKRVSILRKIIPTLLTMDEVDKKEIFNLLKKCAINKLYLQMPEGLKVVSLSLTLDLMYIAEIHSAIKSRLSYCSLKTAVAYGKIYYDAWSFAVKNASENFKNVLEITCIEDLVLLGVNSKHNKTLLLNVRKLLKQIHLNKKESYVTNMLYNLYQPLLWRYLRNYDAPTRANATQLFLDVFPIANPDMGVVATDLHLNEQLLMIKDLLLDEVTVVRVVTVIGLCIAMSVNWELFPEEILKTYFRHIVEDLCCDSTSPDVRCAVAKGIKVLLENPLTFPTLQRILPKVKNLFHDVSDSVRIAFCQVLMRVKRISSIKYFNIVEPDHLLLRLEDDCHAVSRAIVNLLSNSYFPRNTEIETCMRRCIQLVKTNHTASRVFFRHITSHINLDTAVKFIVHGVKAIHHHVATISTNILLPIEIKENIDSSFNNLSQEEKDTSLQNPVVIKGIFDAAAILWIASKQKLDKDDNKSHIKYMVAKLSKCLPDLLIYFKESPTWESLCYLSSYMPSNKVPSLSSLCYFTLQTLPEDAKPEEFMTALESLCNQNACQELLELIQEWIDYGVININASSPASKRRRSSKKIIESNKIGGKPKPYLATHMLSFMLDHRVCQNTMLHGCEHMLIKMLSSIDLIKVKVEQMNKTSCNEKNSDFLRENIFNFVKISALLYHNNVEDGNKFIEDLISWCSGTLLKHLNSNCNIEAQYNGRKRKSKKSLSPEDAVSQLAVNICKDILTMCSDLIALGLFDTSKCSALLLSAKLLKLGVPSAFILPISKLLNKHLFHSIILFAEISDTTLANKVPPFFCEIIHSLAKEKCVESLPSGETREIQLILSNIVQTVYEGNMYKNEYSGLISSVAENMLDNFVKCSKVIVEKKNCEPFKDILIPTAGGFFFGIMVMRPKMMPLYAKALYKFFNNSEIKIENFVAYCIILCNIAEMKNVSSKTCNHINCLLKSMKVTLNSIYPPRENETDVENCTDDESAVVNTPSKKESFRNHCRTEFAKLQRLFIYKNRTANTIIDGA